MCFVLYIATDKPLPIVPWDENSRGIHTEPLSDHDNGVAAHFLRQHVCYIGSDTHCGCGFRNANYQNGSWPEEEWRPEDDTSHLEAQPNHDRLVEFVRRYLPEESSFELYGMWEADVSAPALSDQRIHLDRLLDENFYFRDRGHYTVELRDGEPRPALHGGPAASVTASEHSGQTAGGKLIVRSRFSVGRVGE